VDERDGIQRPSREASIRQDAESDQQEIKT
jgi:hypothetical protein